MIACAAQTVGVKRSAAAASGTQQQIEACTTEPAPHVRSSDRLVQSGTRHTDAAIEAHPTSAVCDSPRVARTRVENHAESGTTSYGDAIGPDLQYQVMKILFRDDPLDALRYATLDRQHWAILESIKSTIVRTSALISADVPITARRLLAANVGLARGLAGGSSPQDWEAAVAASLMEGFVRFLFTGGCVTLAAARTQRESVAHARYTEYDTTHAGDAVTAILDGMTLEGRVPSLYEWIMQGSFGAFLAKRRQSRFRTLLSARGVCRGYFNRHDCRTYLLHLDAVGVRVGNHPRRPWTGTGGHGLSTEDRALQPILFFPQTYGRIFPDAIDCAERPLTWRDKASGETRTAPIDSPDAEATIRDYLDSMVRQHTVGPCARIQATGDLAVPTFSDFFPGAIYLADVVPDVALMMDLRSPRIERLLGQQFRY
ncbi:hypothetical protein psal_cds_812 [Pandoravirus salinus]|uniref:Uncharacterized protein n=1 Tax=Pandoravirus salinus TaxID=1349410 RepID=S4W2R3_9VIRU|nr:hypothetical protein psal_cds_812 [Pandoravirus salinus]AGO84842.1 hypothetical protein psal_cds_812 [Pandoravirus salinus]